MTVIIPSTAQVMDIARQANARHLHIITDGKRTVLSPEVPPGWFKVAVKLKPQKASA